MEYFFLEEIDSTNKYAKEHIKELSDKTVVYTYNQTNGRGRLNRKWSNLGEDNIYASIVLAEGVNEGTKLSGLVLGFGINLNTKIEKIFQINQPATSLNIETGKNIDKEIFLKKLLDKFCLMYDKFIEEGFLLIKNDYIRRANFLNKEITVKVFDKEICGIAAGITDNGALRLIDRNNNEHVLLIGDIL